MRLAEDVASERVPVRALLIEDSATHAVLVRELLRTARGLDVDLDWCETLDQGLARTGREEYSIILLDLGLPDSDGLETLQAMHAAAPLTPIVVLSGNDDEEVALRSLRHGAQDYILKSQLDRERLGMAIRYALERRRSEATLRQNESHLAELFAQIPQGILLLDARGRVLFSNPLAQEYLIGLSPERVRDGEPLPPLGGVNLEQLLASEGTGRPVLLVGEGWSGDRTYEARARTVAGVPRGQRLISLREVTEDEEQQRSLVTQNRVAAMGIMATTISEQFSDLLDGLEAAGREVEAPPRASPGVRRQVATLTRQLDHARQMVNRIVRFSRDDGAEGGLLDLAEALLELGEVLHHLIPEHIDVEVELEPGEYPVLVSSVDLQQIFTNLAVNARDAMSEGGRLTLALTRLVLAPGDLPPLAGVTAGRWAVASVADTGKGVPPEDVGRVFDPFFTTKSGDKATGLGLTQVFRLVRAAGGFVTLRSRKGRGARFLVYLPLAEQAVDQRPRARAAGGTVLLVGGQTRANRRLVEVLEGLGYRARLAHDVASALQVYADDSDRIDAVLCNAEPDIPGGPDGRDLAAVLHDFDPLVRVLLLTPRSPSARTGRGHPAVYAWVQSPVEVLALQAALARATRVAYEPSEAPQPKGGP